MTEIRAMLTDMYTSFMADLKSIDSLPDFSELDVTPNEFKYLSMIYEKDSPTSTEFAKLMNITKPAATQVVKKLIDKGLLEKRHSMDDKRVYTLHLTDLVLSYFVQYDKVENDLLTMWLELLSPEEKDALHQSISKLYNAHCQ